jgi:hypothetical protein
MDADGLTNYEEFVASTDPYNPDPDADTLPDGFEATNARDPVVADYQLYRE